MTARRAVGSALAAVTLVVGSACSSDSSGTVNASTAFTASGYVVPWDERSQASAGAGVIRSVSPAWYVPTDSGGIVFASPEARASVPKVTSDSRARGVRVAPSISNFRNDRWDGELIAKLVSDPHARAAHVAAIAELVRTNRWTAVDIDYESLPASARAAYSRFIAELATALHKEGARLSVTLHAKTEEPGNWSGAQAQDWRAIGAAADEVRVMAYDYSYAGSDPGPIAPPTWVGDVLALAVKLVASQKIVLGVPTYGYDWSAGGEGRPVEWTDVQSLVAKYSVKPQWDKGKSSPWFRYTDDKGTKHTVWYEDARSLAAKLDVARRHGVNQIVLWRLGGEDPGVWSTLRTAR